MSRWGNLVADLAENGFAICPQFLTLIETDALTQEADSLRALGKFRSAGVGQGETHITNKQVRRDETLWFDPSHLLPAQAALWLTLGELMSELNRAFYLGLWDFEGHFAHYEPGAFYKRHLDRFLTDDLRTVSCVLYFNKDWHSGDGGELKIFGAAESASSAKTSPILVEPRAGTLVCFLSDKIEHEVLITHAPRLSFAGWFRRRGSKSLL